MLRAIVFTALCYLSCSLAAQAQTNPAKNAQGTPPAVPGAMPGAMPGASPADMQKQWEQMQQQLLTRFDVDKNGALSDQEKLMAQEAMRREGINLGVPPGGFQGSDQFLKQFDRDGDGKLNPQESMAAQAAYQRMMGGAMGGGMRGGLRGGGGGGGGSAMPPQPIMPAPNPADSKASKSGSPLVKRFDKDGDGKLNAEEKAAAQAELKKDKAKPKDAKAK